MRHILFTFLLMLGACAQKKSSQHSPKKISNDTTTKKVARRIPADSLQITPKLVTGQFDFHRRSDFVQVADSNADKEVYLQKKTYAAFLKMAESARKEGIKLVIVSGTRNFNYQKSIWDRKWQNSDSTTALGKAKGILAFSSMPMTSRHHWGTDVDINNLNNSYFEKSQGKKEYDWLKKHAHSFGFYQPYTDKAKNGRTGYNEEKWHWSFMPLAGPYLAYYNAHISNDDISGFKGADLAPEIDMVDKYVNGVSVKVKQYKK